jgi:hypothetical protein
MSLPTGKYSREWLGKSRERMTELEEKLCAALPEQIYFFLRERHPAICMIAWQQGWPGIYRSKGDLHFGISLKDIDIDGDKCCAALEEELALAEPSKEVEVRRAHCDKAAEELIAFLATVPVCVMVKLFGHSHQVWFYTDSHGTEPIDP